MAVEKRTFPACEVDVVLVVAQVNDGGVVAVDSASCVLIGRAAGAAGLCVALSRRGIRCSIFLLTEPLAFAGREAEAVWGDGDSSRLALVCFFV